MTDDLSAALADLPSVDFNAHPQVRDCGVITVDFDIEEIPAEDRRPVREVMPACDESIAGYYVAAVIKQPEDLLIVPPHYRACSIRKKKPDATRPPEDRENSPELVAILKDRA